MKQTNIKRQWGLTLLATSMATILTATSVMALGNRGARRGELRTFLEFYNEYVQASDHILDVEDKLRKAGRQLEATASEKRSLKREVESLETEKVTLASSINSLKRGIAENTASLQVAKENKLKYAIQVERLAGKVSTEQANVAPLLRKKNETQKAKEDQARGLAHLQRLRDAAKTEVNKLNQTLSYQQSALQSSEKAMQEAMQAVKAGHTKLASIKQQNSENESKINSLKQQIEALRNEAKQYPPRSKKARELYAQALVLKGQKEQLEKKRKQLKKQKESTEKEIAKQINRKDSSSRMVTQLRKAIPQTQAQLDTQNAKLADANSKIPTAKQRLAKKTKLANDALSAYNAASRTLNNLLEQQRVAKSNLADANNKIQMLTNSIASSEGSLKSKKQRLGVVTSAIPTKKSQLEDARDRFVTLESKYNRLSERFANLQDIMDFPVMSTNNGEIVNIFVGGDRVLSSDTQYVIDRSLDSGQKVMFWVITRPNSDVMYRLEGLTGVRSVYGMYDSDALIGEGVLSGTYVQADTSRDYLEPNLGTASLMMTRSQRVAMTANRVGLNGIVITTTINPNDVRLREGRTILDRLADAYADELVPPPVDDRPLPPPIDEEPLPPPVDSDVIEVSEKVSASIPDNDSYGVTAELDVKASYGSKITGLELELEITHTYVGDLEIELVSPSGFSQMVRSREGGSQDNLYLKMSKNELSAFSGEDADGVWKLIVRDKASRDTGVFENVTLILTTN